MPFEQTTPIYTQIARQLREMIVRGAYGIGEKLPSVREMSYHMSVNPNTVQRAFAILENEGLVITEGTHGRRVTENCEIINAARYALVNELVGDFSARLFSLGISASEGARMVENYNLNKEDFS